MCKNKVCKTNDSESVIYCPECLAINFPLLNIEDLYEMYVEIVECIDRLNETGDMEVFDTLSPGEIKDTAFDLYNELILIKQKEE